MTSYKKGATLLKMSLVNPLGILNTFNLIFINHEFFTTNKKENKFEM